MEKILNYLTDKYHGCLKYWWLCTWNNNAAAWSHDLHLSDAQLHHNEHAVWSIHTHLRNLLYCNVLH